MTDRSNPAAKTAWLTFDDGPIPDVTPAVLDILDRYDVKATFFVVGENVMRYPSVRREVRERGHSIGNHTMHHVRGYRCGHSHYLKEVERGGKIMRTRLFRPPHGFLMPWQLRAIKRDNSVVMHDIVTMDYDSSQQPDEIIDRVKRLVRPGSIIVFHDSLKAWPRLKEALPAVIECLRDEGYALRAIPQP